MKRVQIIALVAVLAALGLFAAASTVYRWLLVLLDPGDFDARTTPTAPDCPSHESWDAHPAVADEADVSLPEHPAADPAPPVADVFYLHPSSWVGSESNGPWDDA